MYLLAAASLAQGIFGAKSAKRNAKMQAAQARALARYNAKIKRKEAKDIMKTMDYQTDIAYDRSKKMGETLRSRALASGAQMKGTPLTLAVDQAKERQNSIVVSRRNLIGQSLRAEQEAKTETMSA